MSSSCAGVCWLDATRGDLAFVLFVVSMRPVREFADEITDIGGAELPCVLATEIRVPASLSTEAPAPTLPNAGISFESLVIRKGAFERAMRCVPSLGS